MVVKQVLGICLFPVREAGKGFILSLRASNRYAPSYLEALERSLAFLAEYAEANEWPSVADLTTAHIEEYLDYVRQRPRYFGRKGPTPRPVSQSYVETQYRRLNRFFGWLVTRRHIEKNPVDLIPHPHIDERTIPTVPQDKMVELLRLVDPSLALNDYQRFLMVRARAMLYILWDTPARRAEMASMTVDGLDLDTGMVLVTGKGRKESWMPLGATALQALWEYLKLRSQRAGKPTTALWISPQGRPLTPGGVYQTIKALGARANDPGLYIHRFRHTSAINLLREGMSEPMLRLLGGWKKIPETYMRTLAIEDAARIHREISPADRLGAALEGHQDRRRGAARGRL